MSANECDTMRKDVEGNLAASMDRYWVYIGFAVLIQWASNDRHPPLHARRLAAGTSQSQ